jgi:outer membrane protein OmpA-like peptidoglycan-associated protein
VNQHRTLLASCLLCIMVPWAIAPPARAQAPGSSQTFKVRDLVYRVGDLTYRIQDMGGKVADLQVRETTTQVRIDLSADVLFAFDKSDLLPKARESLAQAAQIIRDKATGTVQIDGYTDAKGSDAYNQRLSERRAAAVVSWFRASGHLSDVAFVAKGFGAKNPVAPNTKPDGSDDPDGRQKNRRVEITITKKS